MANSQGRSTASSRSDNDEFYCDVKGCEKVFTQKCNLIAHSRKHTGEKPYKCHDCGIKYMWMSSLSSHKRRCRRSSTLSNSVGFRRNVSTALRRTPKMDIHYLIQTEPIEVGQTMTPS